MNGFTFNGKGMIILIICYNPISEIAIFNALIPVFGTIMSCIMLKETFGISNLLGLICTSLGIFVVHFEKKEKMKQPSTVEK